MKVTIRIPDDLYRRVKSAAALRGLSVRDVTAGLYRAWLGEDAEVEFDATDWLERWLEAADDAIERAPPGPSAREELAADRSRLERR